MSVHSIYRTAIASRTFELILIAGGPYLRSEVESAQLTQSVRIAQIPSGGYLSPERRATAHSWWVVREDFCPCVNLTGLSALDRNRFSFEFGIPFFGTDESEGVFDSPAFNALARWTRSNDATAKRLSRWTSHLPGWYPRAVRVAALSL
jgi:hypothetical protein